MNLKQTLGMAAFRGGLWFAQAGIRLAYQRGVDITGHDLTGARVFGPEHGHGPKEAARHLEAVWIEREGRHRQKAEDAAKTNETSLIGLHLAAADAIKNCRRDLQYEYHLIRRGVPGPMTEAEAKEYLEQDRNTLP